MHNGCWFNRWGENSSYKHTNKSTMSYGTTNKMYNFKSKSTLPRIFLIDIYSSLFKLLYKTFIEITDTNTIVTVYVAYVCMFCICVITIMFVMVSEFSHSYDFKCFKVFECIFENILFSVLGKCVNSVLIGHFSD